MVAWKISSCQIKEIWPLITAVLINIALTLSIWIIVYECQADEKTIPAYFFDSSGNMTTGDDVFDGFINGVICLGFLATLSFLMLLFALYNFRKLLQFWLIVSCLIINFVISALLFHDISKAFKLNGSVLLLFTIAPAIYGVVGSMAFLTNVLPPIFHQFFVICNCSMVSVFYLRTFPNQTVWFVLAGIIVWDLFAVLTPYGPLRLVSEKAHDYSEIILRLLMFNIKTSEDSVSIVSDSKVIMPQNLNEEISDTKTNQLFQGQTRSAFEALHDNYTTHLGMGDFVFYSLLIGKAAVSGSVLSTLATALGVVGGLVITLTAFSNCDETIPALPISIFLGIIFHFSTLFCLEPILKILILKLNELLFIDTTVFNSSYGNISQLFSMI